METAPTDRAILVWCDDLAGRTSDDALAEGCLNLYDAHTENFTRAEDGLQLLNGVVSGTTAPTKSQTPDDSQSGGSSGGLILKLSPTPSFGCRYQWH